MAGFGLIVGEIHRVILLQNLSTAERHGYFNPFLCRRSETEQFLLGYKIFY